MTRTKLHNLVAPTLCSTRRRPMSSLYLCCASVQFVLMLLISSSGSLMRVAGQSHPPPPPPPLEGTPSPITTVTTVPARAVRLPPIGRVVDRHDDLHTAAAEEKVEEGSLLHRQTTGAAAAVCHVPSTTYPTIRDAVAACPYSIVQLQPGADLVVVGGGSMKDRGGDDDSRWIVNASSSAALQRNESLVIQGPGTLRFVYEPDSTATTTTSSSSISSSKKEEDGWLWVVNLTGTEGSFTLQNLNLYYLVNSESGGLSSNGTRHHSSTIDAAFVALVDSRSDDGGVPLPSSSSGRFVVRDTTFVVRRNVSSFTADGDPRKNNNATQQQSARPVSITLIDGTYLSNIELHSVSLRTTRTALDASFAPKQDDIDGNVTVTFLRVQELRASSSSSSTVTGVQWAHIQNFSCDLSFWSVSSDTSLSTPPTSNTNEDGDAWVAKIPPLFSLALPLVNWTIRGVTVNASLDSVRLQSNRNDEKQYYHESESASTKDPLAFVRSSSEGATTESPSPAWLWNVIHFHGSFSENRTLKLLQSSWISEVYVNLSQRCRTATVPSPSASNESSSLLLSQKKENALASVLSSSSTVCSTCSWSEVMLIRFKGRFSGLACTVLDSIHVFGLPSVSSATVVLLEGSAAISSVLSRIEGVVAAEGGVNVPPMQLVRMSAHSYRALQIWWALDVSPPIDWVDGSPSSSSSSSSLPISPPPLVCTASSLRPFLSAPSSPSCDDDCIGPTTIGLAVTLGALVLLAVVVGLYFACRTPCRRTWEAYRRRREDRQWEEAEEGTMEWVLRTMQSQKSDHTAGAVTPSDAMGANRTKEALVGRYQAEQQRLLSATHPSSSSSSPPRQQQQSQTTTGGRLLHPSSAATAAPGRSATATTAASASHGASLQVGGPSSPRPGGVLHPHRSPRGGGAAAASISASTTVHNNGNNNNNNNNNNSNNNNGNNAVVVSSRHGSINSQTARAAGSMPPRSPAGSFAATPRRSVPHQRQPNSSSRLGGTVPPHPGTPPYGSRYMDTPSPTATTSNENSSYFVLYPSGWGDASASVNGGGGGGDGHRGSGIPANHQSEPRMSPWLWQTRAQGSSGLLTERNRTPDAENPTTRSQQQFGVVPNSQLNATAASHPAVSNHHHQQARNSTSSSSATRRGGGGNSAEHDGSVEMFSNHVEEDDEADPLGLRMAGGVGGGAVNPYQAVLLVGTDAADPFALRAQNPSIAAQQQLHKRHQQQREESVHSSDYSDSGEEDEQEADE